MPNNWLTVDINGLAKILADKPKSFLLFELIQNAWDENVAYVTVTLEMIGRGLTKIEVVDDNPSGFSNITEAFTLYAESKKKTDATRRGRFNVGEKHVLAFCNWAEIVSTNAHVVFEEDGTRRNGRQRTVTGTRFTGHVRMTISELADVERAVTCLFPPADVETIVNGVRLEPRTPLRIFTASLPTVIADEEGVLRRTVRKTEIRIYEPYAGEVPTVYELGIPVVESNDRFHVDIQQKVPLGQDRDSLPPAYLRTLRTEVLNATFAQLHGDEAKAPWIDDALTDEAVAPAAVLSVVTERFGPQRVAYDPSDREANARAADQGYTVVHGGSLSRAAWANVRAAEAIAPAGRVFPTSLGIGGGSPFGTEPAAVVEVVTEDKWSNGMRHVAQMTRTLMTNILGPPVNVQMVLAPIGDHVGADYCNDLARIRFNLRRLGRLWFEPDNLAAQLDCLIHEAAHDRVSDHFSEAYYRECTRVGGLLGMHIAHHPSDVLAQSESVSTYAACERNTPPAAKAI